MTTKPKGNGCGPSWLPSWAWPDFGFTKICNAHDDRYKEGGTEDHRFSADSLMQVDMSAQAASQKSKWKMVGQSVFAPVNLFFVRIGGWASFNYRKRQAANVDVGGGKAFRRGKAAKGPTSAPSHPG